MVDRLLVHIVETWPNSLAHFSTPHSWNGRYNVINSILTLNWHIYRCTYTHTISCIIILCTYFSNIFTIVKDIGWRYHVWQPGSHWSFFLLYSNLQITLLVWYLLFLRDDLYIKKHLTNDTGCNTASIMDNMIEFISYFIIYKCMIS